MRDQPPHKPAFASMMDSGMECLHLSDVPSTSSFEGQSPWGPASMPLSLWAQPSFHNLTRPPTSVGKAQDVVCLPWRCSVTVLSDSTGALVLFGLTASPLEFVF